MDQDYGSDIRELREEMEQLKALFAEYRRAGKENENVRPGDTGRIQPIPNMHPDVRLSGLMDKLTRGAEEKGEAGSVTYLGVFSSGGRQANWIRNEVSVDELLALVDNKAASAVLQSIGSNDRLNLLVALLRKPMTVAAMVESCGFNSTGRVYHHLRPLISADIVFEVEQGERGVYAVRPHRVQGIIMLLAGIADLMGH